MSASFGIIRLRRSRQLFFLLFILHALAFFNAIVLPWHPGIRALLAGFVLASAFYSTRKPKITELANTAEKGTNLIVHMADKEEAYDASVLEGSTVFPRLIILKLEIDTSEDESSVCYLTLLPDQMMVDEFRRLSLWLRWKLSRSPQ